MRTKAIPIVCHRKYKGGLTWKFKERGDDLGARDEKNRIGRKYPLARFF